MGFVWVVRRSLRQLTLLTLMASTLCAGQALAARDIPSPRAAIADSIALADQLGPADGVAGAAVAPRSALVATGVFEDGSVATVASVISTVNATFRPAFSVAAELPIAPAAAAPLLHYFSPLAERAPPVA